MKGGLDRGRLSLRCLKSSLALISQLTGEIQMHTSSLQSGQFSTERLNVQLEQQRLFASIGRATSLKTRKKQVKYRGSKTDSALDSLEHRKVEASLEVAESLQHEAYAPIEITPTKVHL